MLLYKDIKSTISFSPNIYFQNNKYNGDVLYNAQSLFPLIFISRIINTMGMFYIMNKEDFIGEMVKA
jgi:hypothetical protein